MTAVNPADAFFLYRLLLGRNPNASGRPAGVVERPEDVSRTEAERARLGRVCRRRHVHPAAPLWMAELDGFRFWFNTSDREMGAVMAMGRYEPSACASSGRRFGRECDVIDAGAQTGFYTCLMASLVGETGTVHAFEPMPESYQLLLKNIAENGFGSRVRAYQLACSNAASQLEASRVGRMYVAGAVDGCPRVSMTAARVDDIVQDAVDFIKIDVEGHEPAALDGMRAPDRPIASDHRVGVQRILAPELFQDEQPRIHRRC